jgi:O-antigen ligase
MLLFLIALMSSSLFAKDTQIALEWILTFVAEGIVPYFLIINAVRCRSTLRRVVTVVMLTCGILGGLSLYQEVTQSYNNQFGGFAQRNLEYVTDGGSGAPLQSDSPLQERDHVRVANRSGGPIGGPNRYAQIMIVILPLALFRFWGETSRWPRLFGGTAAILIASGVLLSYSRGAFLTLLLLVLALVILGYVRLYQALLTGAVLFLAIAMAAPGYLGRMDTIRNASSLISSEAGGERPDGAIRGRATEMFAALQAFLEYPILGVGPGQYTPFYSAHYHLSNEDAFRYLPQSRRAHTLYFELGAETGIVGLSLFLWIAWLLVRSLLQMRRDLRVNCPELSNTATALVLSIMAYFGTAVFLHLSYQRYYWLLLALAGATVQIAKAETFYQDGRSPERSVGAAAVVPGLHGCRKSSATTV